MILRNHPSMHIPKFRNGAEKILANASASKHPDFFGASDIILGYALSKAAYSQGQRFMSRGDSCAMLSI
jgi:hypothetical protein